MRISAHSHASRKIIKVNGENGSTETEGRGGNQGVVRSGHESGCRPARWETQAASSGEVAGIRAVQEVLCRQNALFSFKCPNPIFNI